MSKPSEPRWSLWCSIDESTTTLLRLLLLLLLLLLFLLLLLPLLPLLPLLLLLLLLQECCCLLSRKKRDTSQRPSMSSGYCALRLSLGSQVPFSTLLCTGV